MCKSQTREFITFMHNDKEIRAALKHNFGFESFKGNQLEVIKSLLDGNDVFVLMPTGGGKSLCYQLPALMLEGTAIIISPLIALMKNQVDVLRHYGDDDGVAHFLNSSLSRSASERVRRDVASGKTKLLYVAPESLTKEENINFLRNVKISFYAVDEAHCISEWGHDFRPEYRRIRPLINEIGVHPVIALTATATPKVQHDIRKNLGMLNGLVFKSSFNRTNLYYEVRRKTKDVDRDIIKYIRNHPGESGIIYCLSRKKVEELAEVLKINDIKALPYHAGMDSSTRSANQDAFLQEEVNVIVATIAFGMGIDKPDVRFVIHYDIPKSLEGYYQETGRAGRDGGEGRCVAYYSNKDLQKLDKLMQTKSTNEQEIGRQLLLETQNYAESSVCRRKILLHYFGEQYEEENCGNCDNCLTPKKKIEASEELRSAIEAVLELQEKFRQEYIVNILIGRKTDEMKSYGHDSLDIVGCLKDSDEKFVNTVIRQGVIDGYLMRDIENYAVLRVTSKGREFLLGNDSFKVVEDVDYEESDSEYMSHSGAMSALDPELYHILSDLRKKIARRYNLPPYVIFQDSSIEAMATTYPITTEELLTIPGVGAGKAKRYGKEFLDVIKLHVEANDIVRPDDIRVRSVVNKSKIKIQLIQSIDRKVDLDELAESHSMEFDELMEELNSIVEGGTRLNVDYFIEKILDDEHLDILLDYFRHQETDDISVAINDLGCEFGDDEIKLARLKFISDMGN